MAARLKEDYAEVMSVLKWWCEEGGYGTTFKKNEDSPQEGADVCMHFENEIKVADEEQAKGEGEEGDAPSKG